MTDHAKGQQTGYSNHGTAPAGPVSSSPKLTSAPKPMPGKYDRPAEREQREGRTGHP